MPSTLTSLFASVLASVLVSISLLARLGLYSHKHRNFGFTVNNHIDKRPVQIHKPDFIR